MHTTCDRFVDVKTVYRFLSAVATSPGGSRSREYVGCGAYTTVRSVSILLEKTNFVYTLQMKDKGKPGPFYKGYYLTDDGKLLFRLLGRLVGDESL